MPHPNIKRLRSAKYSNSRTHYSMTNSLANTNRTPIWNKIVKFDNRVDKDIRVLGGTGHSLGAAASTGTIQIQSDAAAGAGDRKLVLGENTISFQEFTLENSNEFGATIAQERNFGVQPTGPVLALLQNNKIKVGDIYEVSGGVDHTIDGTVGGGAKDETWINSVYRVTHIKDVNNDDVDMTDPTKHADAALFIIDNDDDNGGDDLTNGNVIPHADAKIKFRKLVRINKITSGGNDFFYLE